MGNLYKKFREDSGEFNLLHLTWRNDFTEKQIQNHKYQLDKAKAHGKRAWVLFRYNGTHAKSVIFSKLKIPSSSDLKRTVSFLNSKLPNRSEILKVFLRAKEYAPESHYDITEYLFDCLDGDLKVAKALNEREIFLLRLEDNSNQPYNILSKKGTQKLIENIYRPYFQRFNDYFGETIAGIQLKPPELLDYTEYNAQIPWTSEMPEFFSETKGYNLFEYIPLLFYEVYDSAIVRHDFWQTLTQLCSVNYVSTIRKWANNHGIKLETWNRASFDQNSLPPPGFRPAPDVSPLLQLGEVKTLNRASSIRNRQSISRMKLLISSSRRDSDIVVIYPMSSFWVKSKSGDEETEWILQNLARLDDMLKGWGYDYDYGDETLIAKLGEIDKKDKTFVVGQNSYSVVLIPPCITLQESTVKLLTEFISAKGKLVAIEPLPYLLKGKVGTDPYPLESLLYRRRTIILPENSKKLGNRLKKILDKKLKPELKFYLRPDNPQTYVILRHRRKYNGLYLYFLVNSSSESKEILLEFDSEVSLEEWHLVDGTRSQPKQWHANRKTYAKLNFNTEQMRVFTVD